MCVCVCSALISVTINRKWDEFLVPETSTLARNLTKERCKRVVTRGHVVCFFFYLND